MSSPNILIASSSLDRPTWGPVASELTSRGHNVLVYEADKVALGSVSFGMILHPEVGCSMYYGDQPLDPDGISAAWYRRTTFIADVTGDMARQLAVDTERRALQTAIWDAIPDHVWLNTPDRMQRASRKIRQLELARHMGFAVPTTIISNDWQPIVENLPPKIIYKSSYPLLHGNEGTLSLFTTPYDNDIAVLPLESNPYPGLWQPYLNKVREWRITAVDDEVFDAAIYTNDDAKDDWRKHQNRPQAVVFRAEKFPDDLREKCHQYLQEFGLRFGAFDFIEDTEGRITFLECNPNGRFRWIEDELRLPITAAIVSALTRTTKDPIVTRG